MLENSFNQPASDLMMDIVLVIVLLSTGWLVWSMERESKKTLSFNDETP
jgi:hypothetical protein